MTLSQQSRVSVDAFAIKLRWVQVLGSAVLLSDRIANPVAIAVLVWGLASNLWAHWILKNEGTYDRIGERTLTGIRSLDVLVVAIAPLLPLTFGSEFWVLFVPTFLTLGLLAKRSVTLTLMGTCIGLQVLLTFLNATPYSALFAPIAAILFGALAGTVLTSYQSREAGLTANDHRLTSVLGVGSALSDMSDLREMMLHSLKTAIAETQASCGYITLIDEEVKTDLVTEVAYGAGGEFEFPKRVEVGSGLSGYVAKMGQPITLSVEGEFDEEFDSVTADVKSAAAIPLVSRGYQGMGQSSTEQVMGVMTLLDTKRSKAFSGADMELLRALGSLVGVAVSNARMEERRRSTFLRTMESLATALEARDEYTRGHSQRVCEVSAMIGEKMGLGPDALEELRVGTILHDIGKIGVPDSILNKRARLTDEEFIVMKSHPVIGYEICKPLMLSEGVLMIIRNHHEKLDGSGYPDGLKGGELPLSLRIVCVADAFDAMSSKRPYRAVMELSTVLAELSQHAGTQFDPVVVEVLKQLITSKSLHATYAQYWEFGDEDEVRAA
ncbi:MAG: HD domain-containing phosphohydrolase [Fimbriimonadaceae bacterium]